MYPNRMMVSCRAVTLCLSFLAMSVVLVASGDVADAKYKQPGCAKFAKQIKKAKRAKAKAKNPVAKKAAHNRLQASRKKLKTCKANRRVYGMLKNKMIAGTRADDVYVDSVYCANGAFSSNGGESFYRGGWRVENARIRGKNLTAIVRGRVNGGFYVTAVARRGKQWKVGWESFGAARDLGDAALTNARAVCRGA